MDKTLWFPVFAVTKSEPVKVVCNCDGFDILAKAGWVKSVDELGDFNSEPDAAEIIEKPKKGGK